MNSQEIIAVKQAIKLIASETGFEDGIEILYKLIGYKNAYFELMKKTKSISILDMSKKESKFNVKLRNKKRIN